MWIADPKAISHILHFGDLWVKPTTNREAEAVLLDKGVAWAQGDVHKRQRKALTPAFGLSESKALIPRFLLVANKVRRWRRLSASVSSPNGRFTNTQLPDFISHTVSRQVEGRGRERNLWWLVHFRCAHVGGQSDIRRVSGFSQPTAHIGVVLTALIHYASLHFRIGMGGSSWRSFQRDRES